MIFSIFLAVVALKGMQSATATEWTSGLELGGVSVLAGVEELSSVKAGRVERWICSEAGSAGIDVTCDDLGVNELEGPKAELQVAVRLNGDVHEYGLRHGVAKSECIAMKRAIDRLIESSPRYCLRGQFADLERASGLNVVGWVFFEFRGPTGSVCDFCDGS